MMPSLEGPPGKRKRSFDWKKLPSNTFRLLWAALKKFNYDEGFFLASGITFNLLICLIPLILLLLALTGKYLYEDQKVLSQIRYSIERAVPSLDPRIVQSILTIIEDRQIVGVLGLGGLIWASTMVFSSLRIAFNHVFQVKGRGILHGKAIDLLMVLLAGIFLLASMLLTSLVTFLQGIGFPPFLHLTPITQWLVKYLSPLLFTFCMFSLIYKIIPNRKLRFSSIVRAALFSSLLWEAAKQSFGWYVLHLGRFSVVYGSLGTLVIFVFWIYYSSAILILGGEVAFFLESVKRFSGPSPEKV